MPHRSISLVQEIPIGFADLVATVPVESAESLFYSLLRGALLTTQSIWMVSMHCLFCNLWLQRPLTEICAAISKETLNPLHVAVFSYII